MVYITSACLHHSPRSPVRNVCESQFDRKAEINSGKDGRWESGSKTGPRIFLRSPQASSTGKMCHHASNSSRTHLRCQQILSELPDTSCGTPTPFLAKMRIGSVAGAVTFGDRRADRPTRRSRAPPTVRQLRAHVAAAFFCRLFPRTHNQAISDWFG